MAKRLISLVIILLSPVLLLANNDSTVQLRKQEAAQIIDLPFELLDGEMFTKNVWSRIDTTSINNYPLFFPRNKFPIMGTQGPLGQNGYADADFIVHMEANSYVLWNIILINFLRGDVEVSLPFDPEWVDTPDRGMLLFKLNPFRYGQGRSYNYFTDTVFRNFVHDMDVIGYTVYDPNPVPVMSEIYEYEDSIDWNGNIVYYPPDKVWYEDRDIIAYQIKESWYLDKKARVIRKEINAIAPVVANHDGSGNKLEGEKILFWVDFKSLKPFLKEYHVVVQQTIKGGKKEKDKVEKNVVNLTTYFEGRYFSAEILEEDSLHVKIVESDSLKTE